LKHKVGLITNIPSPYRIPLFKELSRNNSYDFHFIFFNTTETGRDWRVNLPSDINYEILNSKPITLLSGKAWDNKLIYLDLSIKNALESHDFDVIINGGWSALANYYACFHCKLKKIPLILWSGSIESDLPGRYWYLKLIGKNLSKLMIKGTDAYIAYGTLSKQLLIERGAQRDRVFIAYNTIDTIFFSEEVSRLREEKEDLKKELGLGNKKVILYVGQLITRKGLFYLLEAFREVKKEFIDSTLLIVGSGELEEKLRKFVDDNNIQDVIFYGFLQKEGLPKMYAVADLFVFPTLGDIWGLVLNEAMSAGLPVITTSAAGASVDLVKGNGFTVPPGDAGILRDEMIEILTTEGLVEKMSRESLEIIKDFTIEKSAKGFIDALDFVLKGRSNRTPF
jgi:glycosyltransferase involved in cell wall biosynthesis